MLADRELCEGAIDDILLEAKNTEVALLVVGDPLGATTHTDMLLRAKQFGVKTQVAKWWSVLPILLHFVWGIVVKNPFEGPTKIY